MKPRGWVYVITNDSLDGLVKIGFSMKDPSLRAKDSFDPAGLPNDFIVRYMAFVEAPREVEQKAHLLLSNEHYKKEWFKASVSRAFETIAIAAEQCGVQIVFETDIKDKPAPNSGPENTQPSPQPPTKTPAFPKLKFVHDYLGWDPRKKAWVIKATAKLQGEKWVLEVHERSDPSEVTRIWNTESIESFKSYCHQHSIECESFTAGRMNPTLGKSISRS